MRSVDRIGLRIIQKEDGLKGGPLRSLYMELQLHLEGLLPQLPMYKTI